MKFAQIKKNGNIHLCVYENGFLYDLTQQNSPDMPHSLEELLSSGEELIAKTANIDYLSAPSYKETDVEYAPAAPQKGKLICIGVNYKAHVNECSEKYPTTPVLFSKYPNTHNAHNHPVYLPRISQKVDYEAELVIIIGKGGKNIPYEKALSHVFGYTCGNDFSARDLQFASTQWLAGKTLDGFAPTGPVIVTADSLNPSSLSIELKLNGELRQSSDTKCMIFDCAEIIHYISEIMTLDAGDIIFTGTPSGVILGMPDDKKKWLADGDITEVTIEGIGTLRNTVKG